MPPGSRRAGVWARLCLSSEYRLRPRQRIALRDRHAQHPVEGFRCRRLGADVPFAAGGIGADDRKIVAAVDPAMPGPDGKKERVSRPDLDDPPAGTAERRSEEHTSELQSLLRLSYAVFCLKKNNNTTKCHHLDK